MNLLGKSTWLVLVALFVGAGPLVVRAQETGVLPPEATDGEWLVDTLDDNSLWFDASSNLSFEPVSEELSGYPAGRRWVGVVDGRPAWVVYFVPGELLGFEVDTHHYAAGAPDFAFLAGADHRTFTPIEVATELVEFEAKWLRLYHARTALPAGTHFLMIRFPEDAEVAFARLTEVWLRCRFDDAPTTTDMAAPTAEPPRPDEAPTDEPVPENPPAPPAFHVFAIRYQEPELDVPSPAAPEIKADRVTLWLGVVLPRALDIAPITIETTAVLDDLAAAAAEPAPEPEVVERPTPAYRRHGRP